MSRLFIIGNGFDVAHGFKTRYSDFRKWLFEKYSIQECESDPPLLPESVVANHGENEFTNQIELGQMLAWLFSKHDFEDVDWNEFESNLHDLDLEAVMNHWTFDVRDREGDEDVFATENNYEDTASQIKEICMEIDRVFSSWIKDIDITQKKLSFGINTIDCQGEKPQESDLFLTFNYTETLEKNYNVPKKQICHIHGNRCDVGSKIIVGHGNIELPDFSEKHPSACRILTEAIMGLKKDVSTLIKDNEDFWNKINEKKPIDKIYSFGFSFSDVDLDYLRRIFNIIGDTSQVVFYLNSYDNTKNETYKRIIEGLGYTGQFGIYD